MIAEDSTDTAETLAVGLRSEGYRVWLAATGTRAMRCYWRAVDRGEYFRLVILDCALPGLDGWSAAANIRRAEVFVQGLPRAYLIGYTGYGEEAEELVTDGDKGNFDEVLTKGCEWSALLAAVRRAGCGE